MEFNMAVSTWRLREGKRNENENEKAGYFYSIDQSERYSNLVNV